MSKRLTFKKYEWVKFLDDNGETHFGQVVSGHEITPNERIVYCIDEHIDNSLWLCKEDDLVPMSKEELNALLEEALKAVFVEGKEIFGPGPIF